MSHPFETLTPDLVLDAEAIAEVARGMSRAKR